MNEQTVAILPALGDNYTYLIPYEQEKTLAIDPGDAGKVLEVLGERGMQLGYILATHHHGDHTGGIGSLKGRTGCKVIGPDAQRIAGLDKLVKDGDTLELGDVCVRCIGVPGHTATSMCYLVTGKVFQAPLLFTGDTLFVCGCGRVLEADMQTMYNSLRKLAALPDETLVYPGHDYTEENVRFAMTVELDKEALQKKLSEIQIVLGKKNPRGHRPPYTVPSTMGEEKRLNPFLRAKTWQEFAELRKQKDVF
jgi:hydroxyacylglutathione hydrolase